MIGLVPQELTLGAFDRVANSVNFSRGLFGKKPNPLHFIARGNGIIETLWQDHLKTPIHNLSIGKTDVDGGVWAGFICIYINFKTSLS